METAAASRSVSFSVEGEFLTDLCRDLVTEGRWRHALRVLTDSLPGMTTDQALSVLRADAKLSGVNAVELVAEDRTEKRDGYLDLIAWQHAGLWRRQGSTYWQPYAAVTLFGPGDLPRGEAIGRGALRGAERLGSKRAMFYADDRSRDAVTSERHPNEPGRLFSVLWRRVDDPPLWLEGSADSIAAVDEWRLLRGELDERGGAERGVDWSLETVDDENCEPAFVIRDTGNYASDLAERMGLSGKMAEALETIIGGPEEGEPVPDLDLTADAGYILTDGTFYGCKYMQHQALARRLLKCLFGVEVEDPQIEADRRNWFRIQAQVSGSFSLMSPKDRPTRAQEKTLVDWCLRHDVPYPSDYGGLPVMPKRSS